MTDEPQSALPSPRRPTSTARSRDYRRRKREGLLRAVIELRRYEVARLRESGLLLPGEEGEPFALGNALGELLDQILPKSDPA